MQFYVQHQEQYSRGELLLRYLFGSVYIGIPHGFLLFFIGIGSLVLTFLAFWAILFTGSYPQSWFNYQVNYYRWYYRVSASLYNLYDGYPEFGMQAESEKVQLDVEYPENLNRGLQIVKLLFGFLYVIIPHGFLLIFRGLWTGILIFLAFWVVLFTGSYPESWHEFNVGTMRWGLRVNLYLGYMTDVYPPFSGRP